MRVEPKIDDAEEIMAGLHKEMGRKSQKMMILCGNLLVFCIKFILEFSFVLLDYFRFGIKRIFKC